MSVSEREIQLLTEARALVSAEGAESLTMRRLGKRSQIAAAGIYHYFRSRDDLVDRLHQEVFAEFLAELGPSPADEKAEAVAEWLSGARAWLAEHTELLSLTSECVLRHPRAQIPESFIEVVMGEAALAPSAEVTAATPSMVGGTLLLLLRGVSLPTGSVDLPTMVSGFRTFATSLTAESTAGAN